MALNILKLYEGATYETQAFTVVNLSPSQTGTNNKAPFEYLSGNEAVVAIYPSSDSTMAGYVVAMNGTSIDTNYTTLAAFSTKVPCKARITLPQYLSVKCTTTTGLTTGSISVYLES